jgi:ubiquinone/menaquinone biosynthesis C-methylase UbiE
VPAASLGENLYGTKAPDQVSWFRPHLETSLGFIERAARGREARIIDVGGGESTLVDDRLTRGYGNITVLNISRTALEVTKKRLGELADRVDWTVADATKVDLPADAYDIWTTAPCFTF